MYPKIKHIIMTWRTGKNQSRIPVGVIKSGTLNGTTFKYIKEGIKKAKLNGFECYSDFPDLDKTYDTNVLKVFSQRINNSDRTDIQKYYNFWEIPDRHKKDIFYLLAYTEGLLPTDNFEFLVEFYGVKGIKIVSEITGFTENPLKTGTLKEGDLLNWECEPNNQYDNKAVILLKGKDKIGYVKKIHSHMFYLENANKLKVKIKKLEQNGHINKAFILIYHDV